MNCFTYGSLMYADIIARVLGRALAGEPAKLDGYRRQAVLGETYPGLRADAAAHTSGILYRGLAQAMLERLDRFEGEYYQRIEVEVRTDAGTATFAFVYLFRSEFAHLLAPHDWDEQAFLNAGKSVFAERYLGFGDV